MRRVSALDLLHLLVSGGDERLALDPQTGCNMYGYGPRPAASERALSSSTASSISGSAFAAVQHYHRYLLGESVARGETAVYQAECDGLRASLLDCIGCAASSGVEVLLSPSGTDLHLLATLLFRQPDAPLFTLTLEPSETGSSVASAASGSHFMAHSPSGACRLPGSSITSGISNATFAVRDDAGCLRDEDDVEDDINARIAAAIESGHNCLVVVTDVSKTGLIAPRLDTVFRLRARYGDRIDFLIDGCQLRLTPETIRAYLAQGFALAITGSKFLGGPSFSGALFCPPSLAKRWRDRELPPQMADYCAPAELPSGWRARQALPDRANFGLLLRWHAALHEWQALLAIPSSEIERTVRTFGKAVEDRLRHDGAFIPLATRSLDRHPLLPSGSDLSYDAIPTIFPFLLNRRNGIGTLNAVETRHVFERVARGGPNVPAIRLGQPVACGLRHGEKVAALRLCLSARLIVDASDREGGLVAIINHAMKALDGVAMASCGFSVERRSIAA